MIPSAFDSTPARGEVYRLTDIIEALQAFQEFEPTVRAAAIDLYASELNISQFHFYAIALHAGLGGEG